MLYDERPNIMFIYNYVWITVIRDVIGSVGSILREIMSPNKKILICTILKSKLILPAEKLNYLVRRNSI